MNAREVADYVESTPADPAQPRVLANVNLHGLYLYLTNDDFRHFTDSADIVVIDGFPIWLICKLRFWRQVAVGDRVGSTDWLEELMARERKPSIWAIGGTPSVSRNAAAALSDAYSLPHWDSTDGYDGARSLRPREIKERSHIDVVLVGMGMPTQEKWILENQTHLRSRVVANVGGLLDYYGGAQQLAPRWMGAVGLEWTYRFVLAPRRLFHRYFIEPWLLAGAILRKGTR